MQTWAHYLLPGRAQRGHLMPKNISAETNSDWIIFLLSFKSVASSLCSAEAVCSLERSQVRNKSADSLVQIFFFGGGVGRTQLEASRVKRYVKKNDGAETFSPRDFLRHGGHEGSGYSAVWKVWNGCLFKLQACVAARCLGWQITHFSLKRLQKKKKKSQQGRSFTARRSWWMVRAPWRRPGAQHVAACKPCDV